MEILPDGSNLSQFSQALGQIASEKTFLVCGKHQYTPGPNRMPTSGCSDCWRVLYWTMYAKLGPEAGNEWIDGIEAAIHHSVEAVERGEWDFQPYAKALISVDPEDNPEDYEVVLTDEN